MDESGVLLLDRVSPSFLTSTQMKHSLYQWTMLLLCYHHFYCHFIAQVESVFETNVEEKEEESTLTSRFKISLKSIIFNLCPIFMFREKRTVVLLYY